MTILISVENGFSSRYLLRTGVLSHLKASVDNVIVSTRNYDEDYFRKSLEELDIKVIPQPDCGFYQDQRILNIDKVRMFGFPYTYHNSNIDIKFRQFIERKPFRPLKLELFKSFVMLHRKNRLFRILFELAEESLLDLNSFKKVLYEEKVKLIVLDGISGTGPNVLNWSRASKGICQSMAVITNWDHPTTKGYRGNLLDQYLVWGEAMENELVKYHDIPRSRIKKVGSALFDLYKSDTLLSKNDICELFKLDPYRPIILFVSNSPINFPHNIDIVRFLVENLQKQKKKPQLLVRLHPLFLHSSASEELQKHLELGKKQGIAYSIPKVLSQSLLPDMDLEEISISSSLVNSSDVIVNIFSTMQLDACVCDKPIINIGFDWSKVRSGTQVASLFKNYIHLNRLIELGAVKIASDPINLISLICQSLDRAGEQSLARRNATALECGELGNAKEKISQAILSLYNCNSKT